MLQNNLNNQFDIDNLTNSSGENVFVFPTSFAQERLWFLEQLEEGSAVYNIPIAIRLSGQLNVTALEKSFNEIVRRHEILRTGFTSHPYGDPSQGIAEGQPVQVIADRSTLKLPTIDLRTLSEAKREQEAKRLAKQQGQQKFNLTQAPLLRLTLLQLDQEEHILVLIMHHIISDAWSMGNFIREISTIYPAFCEGKASPLPELPIQYADFAVWQRQQLQGEVLDKQLNYWKQQLGDKLPVLELPTDYTRPSVQTFRGGRQSLTLPQPLSEDLKRLSQQQGTTLYMTLLTAFKLLLHRYSGQTDLLVGSTIANRNRSEIEELIGFFVNTLVLRTNLSENPSFLEYLHQVKQVTLDAYANQDLPFEKLVEELQPERNLSHSPLFQVMFVFQNALTAELALPDLELHLLEVDIERAKFDLMLSVEATKGGLEATFDYSKDLFEETTINRMLTHFQTLLEGVIANPAQPISDLPLLTSADQHQLLVEWNNTKVDYPQDKCIHHLFEEQVEHTPEAIALVFEEQQVTYRELNARANQLAHYLQQLGVGPEVLVGICLERSLEMVVGLLGILKAGGAYVPMDPTYPRERLTFMLQDSQVSVLLTQQELLDQLPENQAQLLCLDNDWEVIAQESSKNPINQTTVDCLAYVIYTSGSTGKPKGTLIPHRGLVNYLNWCKKAYTVAEGKGSLVHSSIAFDLTITSLFSPLLVGCCVKLLPNHSSIETLYQAFRNSQNLSLVKITPAHLELLNQQLSPTEAKTRTRALIIGGENLLAKNLSFWQRVSSETMIVNEYGPTETVVGCCIYQVPKKQLQSGSVPIGQPIANTELYVLDSNMQPVPIGVIGELFIGGVGIGRGYLRRPELTADKFVPNPFASEAGARLYKTGDLARYLPDGNLEYVGRLDDQIKIRGFRVELGEVEALLNQYPEIQEAVVAVGENHSTSKQLVGYIVPQKNTEISWNKLREFLKGNLPDHMIPTSFVTIEKLPLTPSGKVDRQALPKPDADRQSLETNYVAPRTREEKILADIWCQLLNLEQVGIHDNFFELGGDSILNIQVVARANKVGLQFTHQQLFQHQTIAELARILGTVQTTQTEQGMVTGTVPLTPIQHCFFEQNLPNPHHWNQAVLLETRKSLEPALLVQVVQYLIQYHDALRLRFFQKEGTWQQYNADFDGVVPLTHFDLSGLPEAEQRSAIEQAASSLQGSLNISQGPLLRVAQFHLGANQSNRLLIVIHHLAVDGVSWRILLEDFQTLYQQLQNNETLQLPEKTTSFRQWSESLQKYAQSEKIQQELDYWLKTLSRVENRSLPVDYASEENTEQSAQTISVTLSKQETETLLREVPAKYRTQINEILLTAFVQTFAQQLEIPNLLVNLEGHGREELMEGIDLSRTVGWFTSLCPVYLDVTGISDSAEAIKTVKEQLRQIPNNGMGYGLLRYLGNDKVVEKLKALPQPEVSFNYLGQFDQTLSESSIFQPARESKGSDRSLQGERSYLLNVNGLIVGEQFQLNWTYSQAIHKQTTIEKLAQSFIEVLRSLIKHCQSLDSVVYTPSDFPLAKLNQKQLDTLKTQFPELEDIYPLSPMQQGLLFHSFTEPNSETYCSQFTCTLEGNLDISALKQSWQLVMSRHAIFRTAFVWENLEQPLQIVCQTVDLPWYQYDWQTFSSQQQQHIESLLQADRSQGFVLNDPPVMRLTLIKLSHETYQLIWSCHHILLDGWSTALVLNEVLQGYHGIADNQPPSFSPTASYRDYISWLQQQNLSQAKHFWQQILKDFTAPNPIPIGVSEKPKKQNQPAYDIQKSQLSTTTTTKLNSILKSNQLTLNTAILGAWALLLNHCNGQEDIVFGTTSSGRSSQLMGIESMVGLFINTLPVRVNVENEAYLIPWLQQLQDQQIEAREYEYTPLAKIHQWSDITRGNPLFNSLVVFENYPIDSSIPQTDHDLEIKDTQYFIQNNYPITLRAIPKEALELHIMYDCSWFERSAISDVLETVTIILNQFTEASQDTIQKLRNFISQAKQEKQSKKEQQINHLSLQKFKTAKRKKIGQ